jgi:threonine/homoserine/homoserine lactone efflux protein
MIEPAKFALFISVSWALIISPGPDMIYVITRGMAHGRQAGILSAIGVVCGILVHTTATAFGLTLILQTSAFAFLFVKFIGAVYLLYLGVKAWRDKSTFLLQTSAPLAKSGALFWQGMLSNVLNPKIAIFFLAFLPQFVDKGSSRVQWTQIHSIWDSKAGSPRLLAVCTQRAKQLCYCEEEYSDDEPISSLNGRLLRSRHVNLLPVQI